jgi:cytochrome P450
MTTMEPDVYYDPYDFEIDSDPYPVWKRLRDERPLYYNENYDFYALSRFDDVERCSLDWESYISSKGTLLEIIKSGMELPPGSIIFEDPPAHNIHRRLLSRVFTPRNIVDLELSTRWWERAGSISSRTSARRCPCAPSACCWASQSRIKKPSAIGSTTVCG